MEWCNPIFFHSAVLTLPRAAHFLWELVRHLSHFAASFAACDGESYLFSLLCLHSMEIRHFLLGLCAFCLFPRHASAESTCSLKAKFNLSGYKDVEKKKVVIGGMFPIHKRIASNNGNTLRLPVSSDCEGWVDLSIGFVSLSYSCWSITPGLCKKTELF